MENLPPALHMMQKVLQETCTEQYEQVSPFVERLYYAEQVGHTYLDVNAVEEQQLRKAHLIVGSNEEVTPLFLWQRKLFFNRLFSQENYLAKWLVAKNKTPHHLDQSVLDQTKNLLNTFSEQGLHENQLQAVALSVLKLFLLICGGPGTGKTTTVAKILSLLVTTNLVSPAKIALAAPTGKAAARMTESLQNALQQEKDFEKVQNLSVLSGQTLHRLLGVHPISGVPRYNSKNLLSYDLIIVDEASMLDLPMLVNLFSAIKAETRLILLGDANQLPAVGAGAFVLQLSVLSERTEKMNDALSLLLPQNLPLFSLGEVYQDGFSVLLTHSYRFHQTSAIGHLAKAINSKDIKAAQVLFQKNDDLGLEVDMKLLSSHYYRKTECYWQAIEKNNVTKAFLMFKRLVILTSLKYQSDDFNSRYIHYLKGKKHHSEKWFSGLPILITENDYQQDLFNGDVGLVMYDENQQLTAYFESASGFKNISLGRLPHFEPAFAITVHKSQGSEYEEVWLIAPEEEHILFSRSLLYTAVTRAKKRFVFWGAESQFSYSLNNVTARKSALRELIEYHSV